MDDGALLEREVALPDVGAGPARVLALRDLRERLDFALLAVRVGVREARVLDHEHRVRSRGQRRAGVDAEDVARGQRRRERVGARGEHLVGAGRVAGWRGGSECGEGDMGGRRTAHGVAVDVRGERGRDVLGRVDVFGEDAAAQRGRDLGGT